MGIPPKKPIPISAPRGSGYGALLCAAFGIIAHGLPSSIFSPGNNSSTSLLEAPGKVPGHLPL